MFMAFSLRGSLFVADSGNNRLQRLSFDGRSFGYLRSFEGFAWPTGVWAYGSDRILVADTGANAIKELIPVDGTYVEKIYAPYNAPHGVAADTSGRLIVADTGNRRVAGYTLDGQPGDPLAHPEFAEPFAVRMGLDGRPLLLDSVAQRFFRLDAASGAVEPLPMQTGLYRPRGFSVDQAGNLVVADTGGGRVVVLNGQGETLWQYGGPDTALGRGQPVDTLAVGDAVWAVTAEDGRLWQMEIGGSLGATTRATTLDGPRLAGLPDGSFFLTDPVRRTLFYHLPGGQPVREFADPGALLLPAGVDVAMFDGQVYLAIADGVSCTLSLWRTSIASILTQ